MKPTMEILTKLQENSKKNHDEVFTRLYRYLLRPDIYYVAYQHLYSNKGAGTKGVTDDTADGFSEIYIENIIDAIGKARERLHSNVNFDLVMELLFMTIREN